LILAGYLIAKMFSSVYESFIISSQSNSDNKKKSSKLWLWIIIVFVVIFVIFVISFIALKYIEKDMRITANLTSKR